MRRSARVICAVLALAAAGLPSHIAAAAVPAVETAPPTIELGGSEIEATVTQRGESLRTMELELDVPSLMATVSPDTKLAIPAMANERDLAAPDVVVSLFDDRAVTLAGTEMTLTTTPLFDANLHVVDWGQSVSWRSSTQSNKDSSNATLTFARTTSTDWHMTAGTIFTNGDEFSLDTAAKPGAPTLTEAPLDLPDDSPQSALPGEWPKGFTPPDETAATQPAVGVQAMPASTPAPGTYVDMMGVVAAGITLVDGFFYLVGGTGQLRARRETD